MILGSTKSQFGRIKESIGGILSGTFHVLCYTVLSLLSRQMNTD